MMPVGVLFGPFLFLFFLFDWPLVPSVWYLMAFFTRPFGRILIFMWESLESGRCGVFQLTAFYDLSTQPNV